MKTHASDSPRDTRGTFPSAVNSVIQWTLTVVGVLGLATLIGVAFL